MKTIKTASIFAISFLILATTISFALAQERTSSVSTDKYTDYERKVQDSLKAEYEKVSPREEKEVIINIRDSRGRMPNTEYEVNKIAAKIHPSKIDYIYNKKGIIASLSKEELAILSQYPEVFIVEENHKDYYPALVEAVDITKAEDVWPLDIGSGMTLDGSGTSIVIVDTGVDFTHPDLATSNIFGINLNCFTIGQPCFSDATAIDSNGHGTFVAGIAAAEAAGPGGINGIAKGANIISTNVYGTSPTTHDGRMIKAIDWAIANKDTYNIKVISISTGSQTLYSSTCDSARILIAAAVNDAVNAGIAVVAAAGNDGSATSISSPACLSNAIAVGATLDNDNPWASTNYNSKVKLFAPGTSIFSTCLGGGTCGDSGTSSSTPMVSGAIAITQQLLDSRITMSEMPATQLESFLFNNADPVNGLSFSNHRRLNILTSVQTYQQPFEVGDVNLDNIRDISDPIYLLDHLFGNPGNHLNCQDSANTNLDASINIADVVTVLDHIFGQSQITASPVNCFPL